MNFITTALVDMSKQDLIDSYPMTGLSVEKFVSDYLGYSHITAVNGHDCIDPVTLEPVEIKAQIYCGEYKLRGRIKYGSASREIMAKKVAVDERTIVVGVDSLTKKVLYMFEFRFSAIAQRYADICDILDADNKKWGNADFLPIHYMGHESFKVLNVITQKEIAEYSSLIQPKFREILLKESDKYHI